MRSEACESPEKRVPERMSEGGEALCPRNLETAHVEERVADSVARDWPPNRPFFRPNLPAQRTESHPPDAVETWPQSHHPSKWPIRTLWMTTAIARFPLA